MNRRERIALARETLQILEAGRYVSSAGTEVDISGALERCLAETQAWWSGDFPDEEADTPVGPSAPFVEVTSETTLAAARRMCAVLEGEEPLCLNFASAKKPGGGFLSGAQAQEETLALASGLYASLSRHEAVYAYNRRIGTALYSDCMIYSPHVPVFRDEVGTLLSEPYLVSFVSAPAVNAGAVRKHEPAKVAAIETTLERRLRRILWVARVNGHSTLVLGVWGCGGHRQRAGNRRGPVLPPTRARWAVPRLVPAAGVCRVRPLAHWRDSERLPRGPGRRTGRLIWVGGLEQLQVGAFEAIAQVCGALAGMLPAETLGEAVPLQCLRGLLQTIDEHEHMVQYQGSTHTISATTLRSRQ